MKNNQRVSGIDAGDSPDLTICSVYHSEMTNRVLEINWDFTKKLNPSSNWVWLAADNSPAGSNLYINRDKFLVVPGGRIPDYVPWYAQSGFQLGTALNTLRKHVKTRFTLFLDYDFFIVRPNWISEILQYMRDKNLGFLGVPYHPKFYTKTRYFPSHHSLFVDTDKLSLNDLDFMPAYSKEELRRDEMARERNLRIKETSPRKRRSWFSKIIRDNLKKRRWIGSSKDVSYAIYKRFYKQESLSYEFFLPVISLKELVRFHYFCSTLLSPLIYIIERILPDRWSFLPRRNSFTFSRFKDFGYPDALGQALE